MGGYPMKESLSGMGFNNTEFTDLNPEIVPGTYLKSPIWGI
jgi:hypothetical protein